jgi:hypothetical protein
MGDRLAGSSAVTSGAAAVSSGNAAPQRHVATLRGTRRPQAGHTRLNPAVWSRSGMSHNKGLVERINDNESIWTNRKPQDRR